MSRLKMPSKGQSAAMMAALQAEHAEPAQPASTEELQETNVTTVVADSEAVAADRENAQAEVGRCPVASSREQRLASALERAGHDELAVVTVRAPASLNRYMDGFVARMNRLDPKQKYRKQDAIAEAFAAFYADHPMPSPPPDEQFE